MVSLGLPPYTVFTLEEMEEATNNFDAANLVGEGSQSHGQVTINQVAEKFRKFMQFSLT